ncbi:MAG TPA: alkaline phosphatase family protein [Blastocatellia bacterium]|nr:alkaline phosphatase family protein [Blastocatellia bacterium]
MGLFDKFRSKGRTKRVVLIGLDGTPCTLARRFIADGTMPRLAELVGRGTLLQMDTSIPDISSVAWTSFMTGSNPGRHGIYGFLDLQPNSYKIYFPNSRHIQSKTLWDVAGGAGRRSVVVNVPSTYPAQPLNGVLISGFVAIDINKATFPSELVPKLKEMDYRIDVDARKVQQSHDALMDDILTTLERRVEVLLHLYDKQEWDLFIGVITETDRLQHFFMDAAADESHKYHSAFKEFYRRVDNFLGQVMKRLADETMMIMSDHGFTPLHRQVYLNRWLIDNGYLKLRENARSVEDIEPGSKAFALDPGRVYINVKGKYPSGAVEAADAAKLAREIKQGIGEITDNGNRIVKSVFERDEIYSGPALAAAPDLCVLSNYGYDLKGAVNKQELMDREIFTGMHTRDDATFFINTQATALRPDKPHINDVAPTVLDSLGLGAARGMDGRSLLKS